MAIDSQALRHQIGISDRNTDVPFFPSMSMTLTSSDFGKTSLVTFNWIQAVVDTTQFSGLIKLVVQGLDTSYQSLVVFPYAGAWIPFKAKTILASGLDVRGNAITSTALGSDPTSDIILLQVYGGQY